jgi:DNA invertase Pin-like site-specific DNA recombinase
MQVVRWLLGVAVKAKCGAMSKFDRTTAIGFLRCEKGGALRSDSVDHQRDVIATFAESSGYEIVAEFADDTDVNTSELPSGPGFAAMLKRFEANGVHTIIVSTAGSFAKDATVQAVGYSKLRQYGIDLLAADAPGAFVADLVTGRLVDRVLAVASDLDDAMKRAHLGGVGERLRVKSGPKHRKTYADMHPEAVLLAKRLHQAGLRKGVRLSLREISAKLAAGGHLKAGKPYHPEAVSRMIKGPRPRRPK